MSTKFVLSVFLLSGIFSARSFAESPVNKIEPASVSKKSLEYGPYLPENQLTVLVTLDGSFNLTRWKEILAFSKSNQIPLTVFVSGVHYLTDANKNRYSVPPEFKSKGISAVGFGGSTKEVAERKALTLEARKNGIDIESKLNGHFNGVNWTDLAWSSEFSQFNQFTSFLPSKAQHVRFPFLAMSDYVYQAMAQSGLKSIVSTISSTSDHFNLVTVDSGGKKSTLLEFPIDYVKKQDTYVPLSDASFFEIDDRRSLGRNKAIADLLKIYKAQAKKCFDEKRPLILNHKFANLNNGAYWEGLQHFLLQLKTQYQVNFMTVDSLVQNISSKISNEVDSQKLQISKKIVDPNSEIPDRFRPSDKDLLSSFWPPNLTNSFQGSLEPNQIQVLRLERKSMHLTALLKDQSSGRSESLKGTIDSSGAFFLTSTNVRDNLSATLLVGTFVAPDRIEANWNRGNQSGSAYFDRSTKYNLENSASSNR